MATPNLTPGQQFTVVYPFAHDTYVEHVEGDEGWQESEVPTWKVGVRHADKGEGDVESIADAHGKSVLTVISVHKPGRFPTRVFFTRTWIAPDGKAFGKTKCRVTTVPTFMALTRGYRHPYVLAGCKCDGCRWPLTDHRMKGAYDYETA